MESIPLYLQAKNKQLGTLQKMDRETIEWVELNSKDVVSGYLDIKPKLNEEDFYLIESLIPDKLDFYNPLHFDSIHGLSHIMRVMFNSVIVSKLINVNTIPYLISASIHDIRRRNDNQDLGHGFRAKRYFLENMKKFSAFNLSKEDITIIEYACQYHETDYENIPQPILNKYKEYIDIFKACDALDRFRQPKEKWWCNPRYVELKEAHGLIKICRKFTIESEKLILESGNIKESIFKTAWLLFL